MTSLAPQGHSRFGASASERWLECPGSIPMSAGMPNESSEYAQEGTALHALSAHCLTAEQDAAEWIDRAFKYEDHGDAKTIEIDEEQAEAVQVYLDTVRADREQRGGRLLIETRFQLEWLDKEFFGTGDCCRLGTDNVLCVYDAKFGKGKPVEVRRANGKANSQLSYYGIGCVEALRRLVNQFNVEKIELVVVQPRRHHRDGPARRVTVSHTELLELSEELVEAKNNALSDAPRFAAGEWCKFCPGAPKCPKLRDFAFEAAQLEFDDGEPVAKQEPKDMTPVQIASALEASDIIEAWIGAVRSYAELAANRGEEIPGYKLVDKRATRKWRDEALAASELCLVFGLEESSIYAKKLVSPAQAEGLLKKAKALKTEANREALATLYEKKSSGTKLAKVDDERPAQKAAVQADFDDGKSETTEW